MSSNNKHIINYKSEHNLLKAFQEGDEIAFNQLFNTYWKKVFIIAYSKVRSKENAEEIVQDVFIKLWEIRKDIKINNFSAYLYTCIKNRCLNYIERQIIHKKHWNYYRQFIQQFDDSTTKDITFNNLMEAFNKGVEHIPEKSRKVFKLKHLEGKSAKEIAKMMNLSEKAIEYHSTNSIKKLRTYLKEFVFSII